MNQLLYKIDNLIEGEVIKRPSKFIKTPYVADILIENEESILGHTASLGCCGLADKGATVLIGPKTKSNTNLKCSHTVYLSIYKEKDKEQIIGIYPKLAEILTENALKSNLLSKLKNIKSYKRETSIFINGHVDSRFDFTGIDENGIPFIMEVKNVPLADYEDLTKEEKNKKKINFLDRDFNTKVAYFPDGYRKKSTDVVSPRALKHIQELTYIKSNSKTRCLMCYVIQRNDVNRFQPSVIDQEYREAVKQAIKSGVEIITLVVSWNRNGEANFVRDDLPITEFD